MASPDRHFANAAIFTHSTGLTPNSGDAALYIKSDNKAYIQDSGGAETLVGPAGTIGGTLGTVDNAVPRADGTGGVTAQGSDINIDDADTTTQANVAITNQHAGETNSAIVLTPKGTGALILGPKPDGTTTGGNARGANAVDLQTIRNATDDVASGSGSVIGGGQNNKSSGNQSVVCGGLNNTSTGFQTFVGGGINNNASGAQAAAIVGGQGNNNNQRLSFIGGGTANSIGFGGGESFIGGGRSNSCSGDGSVICGGGSGNVGAPFYSVGNTTTEDFTGILGGWAAKADRYGQQVHANGSFAGNATGDAQRARFVMRNKTTNDTATELFLDGSSTRLSIPSGKYLTGTINIAGIKSDGSAAASYIRQFSIKNVAATTSLVGTVNTIGTDEAASTSISITADDTNDALKVEVTGIAAETWRWVASVDVVEVAYGT
jgi:hypothetical protein